MPSLKPFSFLSPNVGTEMSVEVSVHREITLFTLLATNFPTSLSLVYNNSRLYPCQTKRLHLPHKTLNCSKNIPRNEYFRPSLPFSSYQNLMSFLQLRNGLASCFRWRKAKSYQWRWWGPGSLSNIWHKACSSSLW